MNEKIKRAIALVKDYMKNESEKPVKVAIMGQTGVGKSSLINALFNASLETDAVKPCTKEIEAYEAKGVEGHKMIFYDLPGIGESQEADEKYLMHYAKKMKEADVILWAIHSDNRSVTFDKRALQNLVNRLDDEEQITIFSKMTFVLTKADILSPPAWVCGKIDNYGLFSPLDATKNVLEQKKKYYQENFIIPYSDKIISYTYNDCDFDLVLEGFSYDDYSITYNGCFSKQRFDDLSEKYPKFKKALDRLCINYDVIPCSSLYKYNLTNLMSAIINKVGKNAVERFRNFVSTDQMNRVKIDDVKKMNNIIVIDKVKNEIVFDFSNLPIF